jgi:hypothetical protein
MAISTWQPGTLYIPGALVSPTAVEGASDTVIPNADFEGGDTGWTKGANWTIDTSLAFGGTYGAQYAGTSGGAAQTIVNSTKVTIAPGKAITAQCMVHQGGSGDGQANAAVIIEWYDGADSLISTSTGNAVSTGAVGIWRLSSVSATAPANAAKCAIGATAYNDTDWGAFPLTVDNFAWNYVQGTAPNPLVFQATSVQPEGSVGPATDISFNAQTITQAGGDFVAAGFKAGGQITVSGSGSNDGTYTLLGVNTIYLVVSATLVTEGTGASVTITQAGGTAEAGYSGQTEPIWPTVAGESVQDNEVTWTAVTVGSITWEASSILTSDASEPTWPTEPGAYVSDNNIAWETIPLRITDENCPHSTVVAIAASKVFAGDTDVVRFCATLNARDWSSTDDAGFLPSGLQQKGEVGVTAMGVYRGNLAVWSPSTFQIWQVDPDPASMALLDAMEGIGSLHQHAVMPVSDDLFFLSALGVRTVGIAEGTNNLASGDVGVPIDTLVQPEMNAVDAEPIATYYPGAGQYWLAFRPLTIAATLLAGQFLLTSTTYPIDFEDSITTDTHAVWGHFRSIWRIEAITTDTAPVSGNFHSGLVTYWPAAEAIITDTTPEFGLFAGGIVEYTLGLDSMITDTTPVSGNFHSGLIVYTYYESIITDTEPVSGTLT